METEHSQEFRELINAVCDARDDAEVTSRLEAELEHNPDAIKRYVEYLDMHASLRWLAGPLSALEDGLIGVPSAAGTRETGIGRLAQRVNRHGLFVLAASVLVCVLSFWLGSNSESFMPLALLGGSAESSNTEIDSGVARITGLVDCQWDSNQKPLSFGQSIEPEQRIELTEGLLQFTFESGAKVVMQGPASFTPKSDMTAELAHGKLSAVVPEQARGYTVTTPTAEVVDLGTEFALDVDQDGTTEVHVLDGDVVARGREADGILRGEAVHARKLDALRFASHTIDVERMPAEPDKFARQITPKLTKEELPPLPVTHDLKFWVAADLLVNRDELGRVSAWRDICIDDNQEANDACQFVPENQPRWIADTGRGLPGVRFNGKSTRLFTDSISTGDRVSVLVACAPSAYGQNATRWGGQLLNFGGQAPTIELAVHHNQQIYSGLWAADAVGVKMITGSVKSERILSGIRCVFAYTYDMDADKAELWVNGKSQGTASASLSPQITGPRTIGGHGYHDYSSAFYFGDIYEVLIYDTALNEAEQRALTRYLFERYHIDP